MFFRYLWKRKWQIAAFTLLAAFASIMMSVFNLYITPIFDAAQIGDYASVLQRLGIMFCWYIFIRLMDYYTELCGVHIINMIRKDIKNDLFSAVIYKQLPDFAQRNSGEYIAEFTNDITIIETKFLIPCKELISYFITIISACVAIGTIDPVMSLVIIFGSALCLGVPILFTKYTSGKMLRFIERFDEYVQYLKDSFSAFFTFKNYSIEDKIVDQFSGENSDVEQTKYDAELSLVVMNNLVGRLAWMVELLVVMIGLLSVIYGKLSIGSVFSAYLLAGQLGIPLQSTGNRISMIRSVKGIENKFKAVAKLSDKPKAVKAVDAATEPFDITLQDVSLSLKGAPILKNVSYTFRAGKKYLILGSNGSGKSTTAKIIKNTYRDYSGDIMLGSYSLKAPEGEALARQVSYSNETVALISDTVKNNILLYREASYDKLSEAIQKADLHVPLDRFVGDGGRFLSSGERRKLEIARALIENPRALIFDEVVSTLDIETAYEIEKLILSLTDSTVIMISNAFSGQLLDKYDAIILMDKGEIIAHGTHAEMLKSSPEYREIYTIRCGVNAPKGGVDDAF